MPLVSIKAELLRAQAHHYAVPLFDTFDQHSTEGMIHAFESKHAPGILAIYAGIFDKAYTPALVAYLRVRAEGSTAPVSIMLDHGSSLDQCLLALKYGCTDLMFDGSHLPLAENIAQTRAIVQAGHTAGAAVEAELGHVGLGSDYQAITGQRKGFTDPAIVERFVQETGVDFLAIAIGNAHGLYQGQPQLDFDLLEDIAGRVAIPLVLHGGTGLPEDQVRGAIARGITKINIATDLYITAARKMISSAQKPQTGYFDLTTVAVEAFTNRCNAYLDLFGATDQGMI